VIPLGLRKRPLHRHPIRAPATSSAGCVGWFFESVIGRILASGCRIETVVGSLCVSSGCTSYPAAQLVTLAEISASYLVQDPMP